MQQRQAAAKFRVWSIFLFIFAGLYYVGGIIILIAWIMTMNNSELGMIMDVFEAMGFNAKAQAHIIFGIFMLMFDLTGTVNFYAGVLLRRPVRKGKGSYIFFAVLYILSSLGKLVGVFIYILLTGFSLLTLFSLLSLTCTVMTVIMLFLRMAAPEDGIQETPDRFDLGIASALDSPNDMAAGGPGQGWGAQQQKPFAGPGQNMQSPNPFAEAGPGQGMPSPDPFVGQGTPSPDPFAGPGQRTPSPDPFAGPSPNTPPPTGNRNVIPMTEALNPAPPRSNPAPAQKPMGRVQGIAGVISGQGYRLPETNKIVVGKDPAQCSMIVNNPYVSGVHCSIRYDGSRNIYLVKDYSSNGTFINNVRMMKGASMECAPGSVLSLADGTNKIKLG